LWAIFSVPLHPATAATPASATIAANEALSSVTNAAAAAYQSMTSTGAVALKSISASVTAQRVEETINVVNGIFKLKTPVTVSDVYAPGFVSK